MENFEETVTKYMALDKKHLAELLAINELYYTQIPKVFPPNGFKPNWFPTWVQHHTTYDGFTGTTWTNDDIYPCYTVDA